MSPSPPILHLDLRSDLRNEVTDLRALLEGAVARGDLPRTRKYLCISHHTTAGFPDRQLRLRIGSDAEGLDAFLEALRDIFPPEAGYEHDELQRRTELSEAQRAREPLNADAHLAFIGGGFTNCVFHSAGSGEPLWFVDFDGTYETRAGERIRRQRRVTILALDEEVLGARLQFEVPVPEGAAALPLSRPELGILRAVERAIEELGISIGRLHFHLEDPHAGAGITVNEAEALLMQRDLVDVLTSPLRFAGGRNGGDNEAESPRQAGARGLARALDALGFSPGRQERLLSRALASASPRILRIRGDASLGVLPAHGDPPGGPGRILLGRYQSPILLQRTGTPQAVRRFSVVVHHFR
jgi:thiamine phosphate synthase YjbQ (UPF0047 family)